MPEYSFSKDKIPKGYSYPLKRSVLDGQLDETNLTKIANVYYCFSHNSDDLILRGRYFGEAHKGWAGAGLSSIWLWAVPVQNRKDIETLLIENALPKLIAWLQKAESEGNVWRAKSRHLDFRQRATELVIKEW
ncbi:MAG: hypothetical protein U0Y68_20265 [Blastocatellia bacterium]